MNGTVRFSGRVLMIAAWVVVLTGMLVLGPGCGKQHPASHRHATQTGSSAGCCATEEQVAADPLASMCPRHEISASTAEQRPAGAASAADTRVANQTAGDAQEQAPADQPRAATVAVEQTTCAVMGGTISKAIFVEYQGKKVYFCCGGCPDVFKADPQKYVSQLPQFRNSL